MEFSRNELKKIRIKLKKHGFNICYYKWCNGKIKGVGDFVKGKNICKECNVISNRESTERNITAYKRIKFKMKLGKKCELCDCDDINMLEFDHLEQEEKNFTISKKQSVNKIVSESKKTRLLCIWCHRLHSKTQTEENVFKNKEDYDYTEEENNEEIDLENSKTCNGEFCEGKLRNRKWFYVSKGKLKSLCKKCSLYYESLRRIKNREYINNTKLKIGGCKKCDKKVTMDTVCCFDFDHIERDNKTVNVSRLAKHGYNASEEIDFEIKKCQLLCCHCHKKKTIVDLNYTKLDMDKLYRLDNMPDPIKNTICPECNSTKSGYSELCNPCRGIKIRKVKTRPSYVVLKEEINETSYVAVGRKYGVSDNAIRKWVKNYEKEM
jgi:hypothetical protein